MGQRVGAYEDSDEEHHHPYRFPALQAVVPEEIRRRPGQDQEGCRQEGAEGGEGGGAGQAEWPRQGQARRQGSQAKARPGDRGAVPERPPLGCYCVSPWTKRTCGWLRFGGRGVDLLQEEDGEEEEVSVRGGGLHGVSNEK